MCFIINHQNPLRGLDHFQMCLKICGPKYPHLLPPLIPSFLPLSRSMTEQIPAAAPDGPVPLRPAPPQGPVPVALLAAAAGSAPAGSIN